MAERGRQIYAANGCVYCHSQQVRADYAGSDIERKWGERRSAPRDYLFERPVVLGKMRMGPDLANIGKRAPVEEETAPAAASPTPAGRRCSSSIARRRVRRPAASPLQPARAASRQLLASRAAAPSPSTAGRCETIAAPPPYSAAWHHRHLYSPRSLVLDSNMPAYRFLYEKRRISGERATDALTLGEKDAVPEGWEVVPTYDAKCLVAYLMSLDQSHPLKELKATAARRARSITSARTSEGGEMNENSPAPERRVRQGMDYGETEDVQQVHAAIQREKREPHAGLEPLSIWLIAIYGLAIFFGGAYLGRYSGNFSGDGLDPFGGAAAFEENRSEWSTRWRRSVMTLSIAAKRFTRPTVPSAISPTDWALRGRVIRRWPALNG